ncbi:Avidin family protein [Mycena indigotica]|uniref:Avidin family protein n=1 Tax=Mycena indigotica TaxID=2126181 RepID=A0A8H6SDH2_9AGAR|nr:Avidin family protein [Mycena indigotica]KAF7297531.1 Avidin family protein [Mycena indigotica]
MLAPAHVHLSGMWVNELMSTMNLTAHPSGWLNGWYNSAVGNAQNSYALAGRFDTAPPGEANSTGITLGWAVAYQNSDRNAHSTAVWSGQFFAGASEWEDVIMTQWVLTTSSTLENNWGAARVGGNKFMRQQSGSEVETQQVLE